jgi:hypothetical protein
VAETCTAAALSRLARLCSEGSRGPEGGVRLVVVDLLEENRKNRQNSKASLDTPLSPIWRHNLTMAGRHTLASCEASSRQLKYHPPYSEPVIPRSPYNHNDALLIHHVPALSGSLQGSRLHRPSPSSYTSVAGEKTPPVIESLPPEYFVQSFPRGGALVLLATS